MSRVGRALRRLSWSLAQRLGASPLAELVYGRYSMEAVGGRSQVDPRRGEHVLTFLASEGLVRKGLLHWPRPASFEQLCRVHTTEYLDNLREPGSLTRILGVRIPESDEDRLLDVQRAMVGGTILAVRTALASTRVGGRMSVNLGGGLHHAHAGRGGGFCVFNDLAVAIAEAREEGFEGRVVVIDLDLHDGDGTRSLFADDESVHTFSIHNRPWDDAPAVADTSIALGSGVGDREYLAALSEHLPPVLQRVRPALVLYVAGCDPAADDTLGDWEISAAGMLARDRFVTERLRRIGEPPTVVTLGGGYGTGAWRYTARFLAWLLTAGKELEVPSTDEITLRRFRIRSTFLSPAVLTGEKGSKDDFGLSEEDLFGALAARPQDTRFLGYYSRHGVELALEQLGILQSIRDLGFPQPTITFELDNPAGQTVRIYGDTDEKELLTELRARRDRQTVPGSELLRVEWILLQNPRLSFGDEGCEHREPLPGQRHPGLGLLRDTMALLVLICDRLGLEGISFVPSHYHMAAQAEEYLAFLDPEDAERYRAFREAVGHLPLGDATRAVDQGRVIDTATGEPVTWEPVPMVMAIGDELKAKVRAVAAGPVPEKHFELRPAGGGD